MRPQPVTWTGGPTTMAAALSTAAPTETAFFRTRLKVLRYAGIDLIAFAVGAVLLAGVFVLRHFGL